MKVIVAVTGASGSVVGVRLIEELRKRKIDVVSVVSESGEKVIQHELGKKVKFDYPAGTTWADIASSSRAPDAMVIVPCSMKTLSAVANGYCDNLISRAADNCLRMRRKLVLCLRETPYNLIQIENMKQVALAGGIVLPLNVAYYASPKTVDDITNFFVGKILDMLGVENTLYKHWKG